LKKYLFLSILAIFFMGCGPRYVIKTEYIAPRDQASKECTDKCLFQKTQCERDCERRYNNCLSMAFDRAKRVERRLDSEYQRRYNEYINKLDEYNYNISVWQSSYDQNSRDWHYFHKRCKKHGDRYACKRCKELKVVVDTLLQNKPQRPTPPVKPNFNQILVKQQSMCRRDCGCQSDYNACFTNCGGEIVLHKICVENCDNN